MGSPLRSRGVIQSVVLLLVLVLFIPPIHAKDGERGRIERLLRVVAVSRVSFAMEGTVYTADEMARHLRDKLEKPDKDLTVENFISRHASSSSRSGRPYMVLENGHATYAGPWLRGLLNEIEKGRFLEATEGAASAQPISP